MTPAERDRLIYELPTNVVVAAGAGTGKTHRLTGLYVHLVGGLTDVDDGPIAADAIVATTFTREAAAEMRARIEQRLRALVSAPLEMLLERDDSATWARELAETCARRNVRAPSEGVWRKALDALPRATITTFHAWAGEIVRAHPIEADVPPGFALIEPEETDELVASAIAEVCARWIDDEATVPTHEPQAAPLSRRDAVRALLSGGIDRLEDAVLRASMRIAEEGVDVVTMPLADDARAIRSTEQRRGALLSALEASAACKRGKELRSVIDEARALALSAHETPPSSLERAARFGGLVKQIQSGLGATSSEWRAIKAILEQAPNGSIAEQAARVLDDPAATRAALALSAAARPFLAEVTARVTAVKRRRRALDFGDVMAKARDLLVASPEVQAELAASVRALLVDEFQDTNALQRDLVYLVRQSSEAIARRRAGEIPDARSLRPRGLFVVGDRKQSIYGFRGADVGVFQQIALDLAGDEARDALGIARDVPSIVATPSGRIVSLDENRRSVDEVLRFVNAFSIADMRGDASLTPVEQVIFNAEAESLRAVRTTDATHGASSEHNVRVVVPVVKLEHEGALSEVSRDLAASLALAAALRRLLDDPSTHGLATVRARDVAILIKTYAILPSLELALSVHGVDYAVAARRGLYGTQEAGDLEAFVRLAVDGHDRNALLAVLRGPYVALSDGALLSLCDERGLTLPDEIPLGAAIDDAERARVHRLREALADVRDHALHLGAAAALRRALEHLGVERTLSLLPRGEQRIGDLRRLIEVAEQGAASMGGLVGFGRHLARGRASSESIAHARKVDDARGAVFDRDDDVVRVMTVHASKGLEFPVVAVMQLEHAGRPADSAAILVGRRGGALSIAARVERGARGFYGEGGRALVAHARAEARAERQRLTYVALTRARDLLFVIAGPSKQAYAEHTAAHAAHHGISTDASLASRPVWTPTVSSVVRARPPFDETAIEKAFGEGDVAPSTRGSIVVTTALAEFAVCARRFRLMHLVGLGEHTPRVPPLPFGDAARGGRGQLVLFSPKGAPDAPPPIEDPEPTDVAETLDGDAELPVGPPPIDPRVQGVVAHLAIERAPLGEATGEGARPYAEAFMRREGYDPDGEPGRALVDRIARFLGGRYARSLWGPGVDVRRELPFVVELPSGISLRGAIDLLVVRTLEGGRRRIEVVDYKLRAGGEKDLARYAFQLRAYAAAAALGSGADASCEIVAGVCFLGSGDGAPLWLDGGADLSKGRSIPRIDEVARELLAARARDVWPAIERSKCDAFGCGYRSICYPRKGDLDDASTPSAGRRRRGA